MVTRFEATKETKAPMPKVLDYFSHVENIPSVHPDFVKGVKVLSKDGDIVSFEQDMEIMRRKIHSSNRLTINRDVHTLQIDTLEGDGKGSKITITLHEIPTGTQLKYVGEMELGPLGFFAKGPAKSAFEKSAEEDQRNLDTL